MFQWIRRTCLPKKYFFLFNSSTSVDHINIISASCGTDNCGQNGVCLTMGQVYEQTTLRQTNVLAFTPWESNHTTMCVCRPGIR